MKLKGYRTTIFNTLAMVPPIIDISLQVVAEIAGMPETQALIPAEWRLEYAFMLAVINIYLRRITTTPIGKQE